MKKVLSLLLAVLVIGACATTDANAKTRRSSSKAKVKVTATPKEVQDAYIDILDEMAEDYECEYYFIHDINGDRIPELFVQTGECEMDYMLHVFTYSGGMAKKVDETGSGHCGFKYGTNCLICGWGHQGASAYWKLTLSGNRLKSTKISRSTFDKSKKWIDEYDIDDYSALEDMSF